MIKRLSYLLLSSFLALGLLFGVDAHATSTVSFEGAAENFVFYENGSPSTGLFGDLSQFMPGDVRTETITVKNLATEYDYIKIYLRAEPDDGVSGLLSELDLKVYQDGELLSSAPASDPSVLSKNYILGTFNPGEETELKIELSAPLSLGNAYQHATGDIKWVFTAEAYKDGKPVAPNTGAATAATPGSANETIVTIATTTLVLAMLTTLILLARKKTRGQ